MAEILDYFGEQGDDCGKCDVCVQRKKENIDFVSKIKETLDDGPLSVRELMTRFSWTQEVEIKEAIKKMLDAGMMIKRDGLLELIS